MATKIVATDAAAKAEIIAAIRVRMNRGHGISGMSSGLSTSEMVMEIRGVNGVVSDIITPYIRAGKATYWEPAWKRAKGV